MKVGRVGRVGGCISGNYVAKYNEVIQLLTSLPETMRLHLSFAFVLQEAEREAVRERERG